MFKRPVPQMTGWMIVSVPQEDKQCATLKINWCISFNRTAGAWGHATHVKRHFQNVLRDLQDAGVAQLAGHTQPGVGRRHCVTKLLDGDDNSPVWNHLGRKKKNINQAATKQHQLCIILLRSINMNFSCLGQSINLSHSIKSISSAGYAERCCSLLFYMSVCIKYVTKSTSNM